MQVKTFFNSGLPTTLLLRRKALGLTQSEVAKKLGLSAMGLSHLERGSRDIKLIMLDKWIKILDLELYIEVKPK